MNLLNMCNDRILSLDKTYTRRLRFGDPVDPSVYFTCRDVKTEEMWSKEIISKKGIINNFPGIHEAQKVISLLNMGSVEPYIKYESRFVCLKNGGFRFLWQIQPDGRYWSDEDGYGFEPDEEIILYADIDCNGKWKSAFRIYSCGCSMEISKREQEEEVRTNVVVSGMVTEGKTQWPEM